MRRSLTPALATAACTLLLTGCSADARSGSGAAAAPSTKARSGISAAPSNSPSASATPALTLAAWYSGGGRAIIAALNGGVATVATDELNQNGSQLEIDCLKLQQLLTPARFYPPIPDAQAQQDWSTALAGFYRGYATCDSGPSSSAGKGAVLIEEAEPDLGKAVERVNSLLH